MKKIELLNGEVWDKASLIDEMHNDLFYYDYLGVNALSSTSCKMILDSPKSYYFQMRYGSQDTDAKNIGRLVHMMALEPDRFDKVYEVVPVQSRATKTFKEHETDKNKITLSEYNECERISNALLRNEEVLQHLKGAEFEIPEIGMYNGLPFRAKADILVNDTSNLYDLKTTSDLKAFKISSYKYSYDLQCYLYCHLFNVKHTEFKFIAIDKSSLDIGIYTVSKAFYESGKAKLDYAVEMYKEFFIKKTSDLDSYTIHGEL